MMLAMVPGALHAAEVMGQLGEKTTIFCESHRADRSGSPQNDTILIICPEGIAYKDASMESERLIPWRHVDRWRYYGAKKAGPGSSDKEYSVLRIQPSAGPVGFTNQPRFYNDLRFKICCSAEDGYKVYEEMNRYRGARRF